MPMSDTEEEELAITFTDSDSAGSELDEPIRENSIDDLANGKHVVVGNMIQNNTAQDFVGLI